MANGTFGDICCGGIGTLQTYVFENNGNWWSTLEAGYCFFLCFLDN